MAAVLDALSELKYDRLSIVPLGGQSEIGQVLWAISYAGEILLIDAGACYPPTDLPGVDLMLPNTNFLSAHRDRISALLLTNGHEEHCGAIGYVLDNLKIKRVFAPRFVSALVSQTLFSRTDKKYDTVIDTVEMRHEYQIGVFNVEWIRVNDAIADACALRINTPEGDILYTSSFKLDQTPVDNRLMDIGRFAQLGDNGVTVLISDSAGSENRGYTPSEKSVTAGLHDTIHGADGRVVVVMNGTNTHRLQILFDIAKEVGRKVVLYGDVLVQTVVAALTTGNLSYDRSIEATLEDLKKLPHEQVLVIATGRDGDALGLMQELAFGKRDDFAIERGDVVVFSEEIYPGQSRKVASIQDQLLTLGIEAVIGSKAGVHVSNHAGQEELKMMLSITKPQFFVPAIGEGRHIKHHGRLGIECGVPPENVFTVRNGTVIEIFNNSAAIAGSIESEAVFFNRNQAESVTRFSVSERRSLSNEGVITIACMLDPDWKMMQPPTMEGAALGFAHSQDWETTKKELVNNMVDAIARHKEVPTADLTSLRAAVREVASKTIRSKMQCKPTINIVLHQVDPVRVQSGG
jgi:ribonuclease J